MLLPLPAITSANAVQSTIEVIRAQIGALSEGDTRLDVLKEMKRLLQGEHARALLCAVQKLLADTVDHNKIQTVREFALAVPEYLRGLDDRLSSAAMDRPLDSSRDGFSTDGRRLYISVVPPQSGTNRRKAMAVFADTGVEGDAEIEVGAP